MITLKTNSKKNILLVLYLINNFSQLLSNQNQIIINNNSNDDLTLHSPIKFTASGINCFLKHTYNHPKYASTIVPHNTGHFLQLLEHGKSSKQDHDYMLAVLRLFRQKISGTEYISASEMERITTFIPTLLEDHLDIRQARKHKVANRKLKMLTINLIENSLGKTLWDSTTPHLIAKQFINIGNGLQNILNANIIDDQDDLNDMIHILVDRFIYVLDLIGADLPSNFYEDFQKQLNSISWMKLPEIEDLITTKLQKIEQTCLKYKIKAHACQEFGIL